MQRTKPDIAEARRISEHHSSDLATYSGETFYALYRNAGLEDWVDERRIRKTFYGETPKTIEHVNRTQYYYLSRANLTLKERTRDFLPARRNCLSVLRDLFEEQRNDQLFRVDDEEWTLRKILRRFVWHDRIHGKAIVRTMQKQKQLGLIVTSKILFISSLDSIHNGSAHLHLSS